MEDINVLQKIRGRIDTFSPQQRKIANYLLNHHENVAFLTATQLAQEIGVSQPTMIRFAQALGFQKYHQFVGAFQQLVKQELTSPDRFTLSLRSKHDIILKEIRTLTHLDRTFPQDVFNELVRSIASSREVVVVGTRGSAALAQYFAYFLAKVKRPVRPLTNGGTIDFDTLLHLRKRDLVVALAFPRYPRETLDIVRFCRKRKIRVAGITDKVDSPLAPLAQPCFILPITFSTIFDSYCSVLCLFNMLVTEVGKTNKEKSQKFLKDFEDLARDVRIFA